MNKMKVKRNKPLVLDQRMVMAIEALNGFMEALKHASDHKLAVVITCGCGEEEFYMALGPHELMHEVLPRMTIKAGDSLPLLVSGLPEMITDYMLGAIEGELGMEESE